MGRRILLFGRRSRLLAGKLFFHFLALPARRAFDHQEDASMDAMPWGLYQIHCPEQPRVSCVRDSCCVRREGAVLKPNKNYNGPPMPLAKAKRQSTQQADVKGNEDQMPQSQLLATTRAFKIHWIGSSLGSGPKGKAPETPPTNQRRGSSLKLQGLSPRKQNSWLQLYL